MRATADDNGCIPLVFFRFACVLPRRLIREKMDDLHSQLSTHSASAAAGSGGKKSKKKGTATAGTALTGEEGAAATLRLLASVARFHRCVLLASRRFL